MSRAWTLFASFVAAAAASSLADVEAVAGRNDDVGALGALFASAAQPTGQAVGSTLAVRRLDEDSCFPGTNAVCDCPCDQCTLCDDRSAVCAQDVRCNYKGRLDECCISSSYRNGIDDDDQCRDWDEDVLYPNPPKCEDSTSFRYNDDGQRGCEYVKEDPKKRCKKKGSIGKDTYKARDACPRTCGRCVKERNKYCKDAGDSCSDDPTWVSKKSKKINCKAVGKDRKLCKEKGVSGDGRSYKAQEACCEACDRSFETCSVIEVSYAQSPKSDYNPEDRYAKAIAGKSFSGKYKLTDETCDGQPVWRKGGKYALHGTFYSNSCVKKGANFHWKVTSHEKGKEDVCNVFSAYIYKPVKAKGNAKEPPDPTDPRNTWYDFPDEDKTCDSSFGPDNGWTANEEISVSCASKGKGASKKDDKKDKTDKKDKKQD